MALSYYRATQQVGQSIKIVSGTTTYQVTKFDNGIGVGNGVENILLPASPRLNQVLKIFDFEGDAFSNNITISGNGNLINGSSTVLINTDGGSVELSFADGNWYVTSFVN